MPIAEDPEHRPSQGPQDDPFAGLVLDEDFVRAATVKEQSGRARMLAAKWKRQPPEPVPHRAEANGSVVDLNTQRRARRMRGLRARVGKRWQTWLIVAVVCGLILVTLRLQAPATQSSPPPVQPAETAAPTAAPSAAPGTAAVDHPWDGSPALAWPSGAAGIALPEARATGVFGRDEVAAQLQVVKDFLVAADVEPKTVAGGYPQAALDLLNTDDRAPLERSLATPTKDNDPTSYISRFDPRLAIPVSDVVKVQGRTTFESDGEKGVLVHTDYTFVYALRPGPDVGKSPSAGPTPQQGGGSDGSAKPVLWATGSSGATDVQREIVRRTQDFRFYDPARYDVNPKKTNFAKGYSNFGNSVCGTESGFLEPDFLILREKATDEPSGPGSDPYDHSEPLPQGDGSCGTITRS